MKTTKLLICAISIVAAIAAARASAQSLPAQLIDISPGASVNGTFNNGVSIVDLYSGEMRFQEFNAFCVEPAQGISYGESLVYQVQDAALLQNSTQIAKLIGGYLASARTGQDAAAVQWAIWEMTTESSASPSLLDGNVRITVPASEPIATLGNQYLANIDTFSPASISYLTNGTRQDVVTWNLIPEPGSLMLAGFSAVLVFRRRR